jgi:hypothetical protein
MAPLVRISRLRVIGCVLATVVAAGPLVRASGSSPGVTVEPRIVEATLAGVSLDRVDVSLRIGLRASRAVTIRSIAFTDAFVGQVPVWIERLDGEWPLATGQELVIPQPVQVRMHARDALGVDDLGAIVRKGSVTVRASVEVGIATPRLARLFLVGPTRALVREIALEMPLQTGPSQLAPLTRLGADLADAAQRGAATWFATGLNRLPGRSAMVLRFGGAIAEVTTRYRVEVGGTATLRERRAAGIWWSRGVFCTTREVIEPWRYDVGDATALQLGGGRLQREGGTVHVGATREHSAVELALMALEPALPSPAERKLHTLVDGHPRRLRLADREAAANLVCLQIPGGAPTASAPATPALAGARPASASAAGTAYDVAAFASGRSLTIVWTSVSRGRGATLRIATPLHRASFGSPLVAEGRIVGLVASPTAAWPAAAVATAAARARPVPALGHASSAHAR